jgi:DNA-binding MarR family transcriptional regulator
MSKDKSASRVATGALDHSPSHLLHRALQVALDIYGDEFGPDAVTQRQYAVLSAVAAREGATQTDLVRITGIDRSTLADMAARMIGKGLLERERSTLDARANAVHLTDLGRATLEQARPKVVAADTRLLKLLSGGGRRDAFVSLLRDMVRAGEDADEGPEKAKGKKSKAAKAAKAAKGEGKKKRKKQRELLDADVQQ